ncbi:uncharacterized protein LOC105843615 isoform X2 [Hydra vulgaris]|uniref:Uncharacterized protein LOC105843615 isoform X2 n=1 Tax=Hydra vulgaris TaxID=6087 RepID=A0ABM4BHU0_HYDVU
MAISNDESMSGSWVRLDIKSISSSQVSPKFSDDEDYVVNHLTDVQAKMIESDFTLKDKVDISELKKESVSEWMSKCENSNSERNKHKKYCSLRGSKVVKRGICILTSNTFFISTLFITHTIAFALGALLGQKMKSPIRT